ncbi:iucA / IucC family protein, partial [Vibrio parahaemolyticus V-223/04]
LSLRNNL